MLEASKRQTQIGSYCLLKHCLVVDLTQAEVALLEFLQQLGEAKMMYTSWPQPAMQKTTVLFYYPEKAHERNALVATQDF